VPKQLGACFKSTVFPAMSVGTAMRITCQKGKFHGMMERMTPSGRNVT